MQKLIMGALAATVLAWSVPAAAQELPIKSGHFWDVGAITIDDGHFPQYADFLALQYRENMEFRKLKGLIKSSCILSKVNKGKDGPDLYLVTIFDHMTTPADDIRCNRKINGFLAQNTRDSAAQSGQRATYRHLGSGMLLQEMVWSH